MKNFKKFHRNFFQKKKKIISKKKNHEKFFDIISKDFSLITKEQIEAARRVIARNTIRKSKVHIKLNFDIPLTEKSKNARMGKGKGKIKNWVNFTYPGLLVFKLIGWSYYHKDIKKIIYLSLKKLPINCKVKKN